MFTLRVKKMILSQKYQNFRKNTTFVPLPIRRNNMKQVEEPAVVYDTTLPSLQDLQSSIVRRIQCETDTKILSLVDKLLNASKAEKIKEFVYANFHPNFAKSLEEQNFFIDKPFPQEDFLSDNEVIDQAEESPIADKETLAFAFSKWDIA